MTIERYEDLHGLLEAGRVVRRCLDEMAHHARRRFGGLGRRLTIRTADGSLAAHHEQTIVVTRDAPLLLTAAS